MNISKFKFCLSALPFWGAIIAGSLIAPIINLKEQNLHCDLAETIYHARELTAGRLPYSELFSHHFLGYVIPFWITDIVAGLSLTSVALLQALFQLVGSIFLYLSVKLISSGERSAKLAAFLGVSVGWLPEFSGETFNNQSYITPLLAALFYLVLRFSESKESWCRYLIIILFASVISFDQRLVVFSIALSPLWRLVGTKDFVFKFVAPVAAIILLPLALLYLGGSLDDFILQTFFFPLHHRNATFENAGIGNALALISWAVKSSPFIIGGLISAAILVICESRSSTRLLVLGFIYSSFFYVLIGGRVFPHYLLIFEPVLLICIALLPSYIKEAAKTKYPAPAAFALTSCLAVYYLVALVSVPPKSSSMKELLPLASAINNFPAETNELFIWGYCPQLYVLSNRLTSFRDMGLISVAGGIFHLSPAGRSSIAPQMLEEFRSYFHSSKPALVVTGNARKKKGNLALPFGCSVGDAKLEDDVGLGFVREVVLRKYQPIAALNSEDGEIVLYKRK